MRMLMWLLLAVLVIFALRKKSQGSSSPMDTVQTPSSPAANDDTRAASAETMLCCERCQVYFPASEAIMRGDKVFCCAAHADHA